MSVKIQEKHAKALLTACGIPSDDAESAKLKGRLESLPELAKEVDFTRPEGSLEKRLLKQVLDAAAHGKEIELVNGNGNGRQDDPKLTQANPAKLAEARRRVLHSLWLPTVGKESPLPRVSQSRVHARSERSDA